jgi:hypothetical protein
MSMSAKLMVDHPFRSTGRLLERRMLSLLKLRSSARGGTHLSKARAMLTSRELDHSRGTFVPVDA